MNNIKVTHALIHFFKNVNHLSEFFSYIIFTTKKVDEMRIRAVKALAQIEDKEPAKEELKPVAKDRLRKYIKLISELWLCRLVESYENYLASVLKDVFLCCPKVLKSSECVKLDDVLKYNTMEDFVKELTEKKVNELSYSSFDDLFDFFDQRLGIKIISEDSKNIVREAIETRNISVHNDCIINKRYIRKLKLSDSLLGTRKNIDSQDLQRIIDVLYNNVMEIDSKLIKKFELPNCEKVRSDSFTLVEQKDIKG